MPLVIFVDDSETALASTRMVTNSMPIEVKQYTEAQTALAEIQAGINEFVAQATVFLDSAEYQKAIDVAQEILGLDPNSIEAKSIIEQATAKLKEAVGGQIDALTGGAQEAFEAPAADLPVLGQ